MATSTTRLSLGTSVAIVPYRHPLLTARASANLDQLTGGRPCSAWRRLGGERVRRPRRAVRRGRITDEFTVITRAWSSPACSRATAAFRDKTGPAPARRPHPAVGGRPGRARRRAARFGDARHPVNPGRDWLQHVALPASPTRRRWAGRSPAQPAHQGPAHAHDLAGPTAARCRQPGAGPRRSRGFDELGADVVVLDTNPDHPDEQARGRRLAWTLHAIAACAEDLVTRACGSADDPMTARFLGASAPPWQGASGCRPRSSTRA